jgi:hypothetical protein
MGCLLDVSQPVSECLRNTGQRNSHGKALDYVLILKNPQDKNSYVFTKQCKMSHQEIKIEDLGSFEHRVTRAQGKRKSARAHQPKTSVRTAAPSWRRYRRERSGEAERLGGLPLESRNSQRMHLAAVLRDAHVVFDDSQQRHWHWLYW